MRDPPLQGDTDLELATALAATLNADGPAVLLRCNGPSTLPKAVSEVVEISASALAESVRFIKLRPLFRCFSSSGLLRRNDNLSIGDPVPFEPLGFEEPLALSILMDGAMSVRRVAARW